MRLIVLDCTEGHLFLKEEMRKKISSGLGLFLLVFPSAELFTLEIRNMKMQCTQIIGILLFRSIMSLEIYYLTVIDSLFFKASALP